MRTTLDIDQDVLLAAKEIAKQRGSSVGKALSELARQALTRQAATTTRNGVPLYPTRPDAGVATLKPVNRLRDAVLTHAHVTDVYLLGLAVRKGGKPATPDRDIPLAAVQGGAEGIEIISA